MKQNTTLDHVQFELGPRRPAVPVVVCRDEPEAFRRIQAECAGLQADGWMFAAKNYWWMERN